MKNNRDNKTINKKNNKKRNSNWLVLKFGGTSVSGLEQWQRIKEIVKSNLSNSSNVFIVHSALSGVSNKLTEMLDLAIEDNYADLLAQIKNQHYALLDDLKLSSALLDDLFVELEKRLRGIALLEELTPRTHAEILSYGELLATTIGAEYFSQQLKQSVRWLDARDWLKATHKARDAKSYLQADCNYDFDSELIAAIGQDQVVITQGFIATDALDKTVLLGRGGSDVSAAYFAAKIAAQECQIWTDVPGMFTASPNLIPSARLIQRLSYVEAQEIAALGAKVLHPKSLLPVRDHAIPMLIKSTFQPDAMGTLIESYSSELQGVCAVTQRNDITLVSMETMDMWQQVGFLAKAFQVFSELDISIDLVSTSETMVTVSIDPAQNKLTNELFEDLTMRLNQFCHVRIIQHCSAISIIGQKVSGILNQIAPSLEALENNNVYLLSQAANDLNVTLVVDKENANKLAVSLHEYLIGSQKTNEQFGPTVGELQHKTSGNEFSDSDFVQQAWWMKRANELVEISHASNSVYIYDKETIQQKANDLLSLTSVDQCFYAVKANHNPDVLQVLYEQGVGFECVSLQEAQYILKLFPEINPKRIMFTPNFASKNEYIHGLSLGVNFTVDSIYPLYKWPEIFKNQSLFLRIDPKTGKGHHAYVRTAGKRSKFGIPMSELESLAEFCESKQILVVGLHAHAGSGILQAGHWREHAELLNSCREWFPDVRVFDLGGGFGVQDKFHQAKLDFARINESLAAFKHEVADVELWLEPGRYYVAEAGVLLTRVTQTKSKEEQHFIGVETGMNSLIRPALYGAYHRIVNLSKLTESNAVIANVVGPICESSDVLGRNIALPDTHEGDVLLIANAGAYGQVMSSSYNMREPAGEIVI